MRVLGDFFALRPVFTFWGLRLIWYVYLANTIIQAYIALEQVSQALAQRGVSWLAWSPNLFPLILESLFSSDWYGCFWKLPPSFFPRRATRGSKQEKLPRNFIQGARLRLHLFRRSLDTFRPAGAERPGPSAGTSGRGVIAFATRPTISIESWISSSA